MDEIRHVLARNKEIIQPQLDPWVDPDPRDASYHPERLINATLAVRTWEMIVWALEYASNLMVVAGDGEKTTELRDAAETVIAASEPEAGGGRYVDKGQAVLVYQIGKPPTFKPINITDGIEYDHIADAQAMDDADEEDKKREPEVDRDSHCTCPMSVREHMVFRPEGGIMSEPYEVYGSHHSHGCPLWRERV